MRLDNYDEFAEYIVAKFENEENISFICDYDLANILMCEFGNRDYELKHIDITNERNGYYVSKIEEEFFCIEPMKEENEIKMTTSDYFIIDGNILEKNPTLFNYLEGDNFKVEIIDYDDEECDCCDDENDGLFAFEYVYPWMEKDRPSLEDAKFNSDYIAINNEDEEKLMCLKLADLIEEYIGLILDNDCKEEILGHALTEFAGKILENFCLEKE